MWNTLPNLTTILARDANAIGGFGLISRWLTITYQSADLGLSRPGIAFTNDYHRDQTTHN